MSGRSPLFVGGTGRSGTTIVARLLGSHLEYHMIPIEVRFLADPNGLCDLASGSTTVEGFLGRLKDHWWFRTVANGDTRGLHKIIPRDRFLDAVDRFQKGVAAGEIVRTARRLLSDLLDPVAEEALAQSWIEMTPANVLRGSQLQTLVPEMRLVHSIRDGREVAASVSRMHWGPDDPFDALDWWRDRMLGAFEACADLGDRVLIIQLEELVSHSREEAIQRLMEFAGLDMTTEIDQFIDKKLRIGRVRPGRWRETVPSDLHEEYEERYAAAVDKLRNAGVVVPA